MGTSDCPYRYLVDLFFFKVHIPFYRKGDIVVLKKPLQVHAFLSSSLGFVYEGQFTEEHVVVSSSLLFAKNCFLFREMQDSADWKTLRREHDE